MLSFNDTAFLTLHGCIVLNVIAKYKVFLAGERLVQKESKDDEGRPPVEVANSNKIEGAGLSRRPPSGFRLFVPLARLRAL